MSGLMSVDLSNWYDQLQTAGMTDHIKIIVSATNGHASSAVFSDSSL